LLDIIPRFINLFLLLASNNIYIQAPPLIIMKLLRAILAGALLWVLIFFEVSILMFGFKLQAGYTYYTIHYVLLALLALIVSLIYFNKRKIATGIGQGFALGIIMIITGIVLDALITVPLFVKDYQYFFDIYLITGFIEVLVISTVIGIIKKS
jgi:hypothetical protein